MRTLAADSVFSCAGPSTEAGVSAAVLKADQLDPRTAGWLAGILDVGGILIQVYPPLKRRDEPERLHEDRSTVAECLVPVRHHIQLLPRGDRDGTARWMLACSGVDLYCQHKPRLVSLTTSGSQAPFWRWMHGTPADCDVCDVSDSLRQAGDILQFVTDAGDDGVYARLRRMPAAPGVMYPGRWLEGKAPCLSLTRIEIDTDGRVRPCRQADPIGNVGDDRQALAARLGSLAREAELRRGCEQCPATHCPRCPFPALDDATYCGIMRTQAPALDFLSRAHLYSRIPSMLTMQRDKLGGD